ncbi:MAG: hypothetical protein VR65_04655 [Desulfobulbaceae bacterium BRH_c16a]|nr:MAG: hypothetical protein VR65_04655 [Desulfobulbaceae bacterium BRH_c16a]
MKYHFLFLIVLIVPTPLFAGEIMSLDENSEAYRAANRLSQNMSLDEDSNAFNAARRLIQTGKIETATKDEMCAVKKPYILVFVSSSMPKYLLKEIAEESFKLNEKGLANVDIIIRGVPEIGLDTFRDQINPENKDMFIRIDPFLFNRLKISQVPVVIIDRKYAIGSPSSILSAIKQIESDEYEGLIDEMEYF